MNNDDIEAIKELLSTPKKIVIIPHKNPDGDALGASLAMYHHLKQSQHQVCVVAPNDYPDFLKWMPSEKDVVKFDMQKEQACKKIREAVIFTLDFNSLWRVEEMKPQLEKSEAVFIMIDHHQQPDDYATYMYSDTQMSSTCEMVYNFIGLLGDASGIDADIATCIYTGMMTDTGSFRFPVTTSTTHRIIADLIDRGVHNADVHNAVLIQIP